MSENTLENELICREEAAKYLKISTRTLRRYATSSHIGLPKIPYAKYGRRVVFRVADLRRWVESQMVRGEECTVFEEVYSSDYGKIQQTDFGLLIKVPALHWKLVELIIDLFPDAIDNGKTNEIQLYLPSERLSDVIAIFEAQQLKNKKEN